MHRAIGTLVLLTLTASASVALAQKVKTDFDPSADFSAFKTYYWAKTNPTGNDLMDQRVIAAVDHWLTTKGWTKASEADADIAIVPTVGTKEEKTLNTFYDSFGGGGWGYAGWGPRSGSATTMVDTVVEGTLIVDLFNRQTKKLVWRGIATGTVSDDPRKNANTVQKAVEKMFKSKFPPVLSRPTN